MSRACRAIRRLALATIWIAVTGCGETPSSEDIAKYLAAEPQPIPYSVESVRIKTTKYENNSFLVEFKAAVRLRQPLYRAVDVEAQLAKGGWNAAAFLRLLREAHARSGETLEKLLAARQDAVIAPVVLEQTAAAGDQRDWIGSMVAEPLPGKWSYSEFITEERGDFIGDFREHFGPKAYLAGTTEAAAAIESTRMARAALVEEIRSSLRPDSGRPNIRQSARQEPEPRIAPEEAAAAGAAAGRPLPLQLSLRTSDFAAGRAILLVRNVSGEFLPVKFLITDGIALRRMQLNLPPGELQELGWLQGWLFKPGDRVEISARSFGATRIRIL